MTLIGYWPLNESSGSTAYDYTENQNDGTISGGAYPGRSGLLGQTVYEFDGTDGYVEHDYMTSPSFTVNIWMKSNTSTWSSSGAGWADRSANGFLLHPDDAEREWSGYVISNSFNNYSNIGVHVPDDITVWHMYTVSHDNRTNTSRMFFDGEKVIEASTTTDRVSEISQGTLGHDGLDNYTPGDRPLDGKIGEARMYKRPLTSTEIDYLYRVGIKGNQISSKKRS